MPTPPLSEIILNGRLDELVVRLHGGEDLARPETHNHGWKGCLPLHMACGADVNDVSATTMVRLLLAAGAVPDARSSEDETALGVATRTYRPGCVQALLDAGADPLCAGAKSLPAAHNAARFGRPDLMGLLLDHGVPIDRPNAEGHTLVDETVLAMARRSEHERWLATLDLLLDRNADVNLSNPRNQASALTLAASHGLPIAVERLLAAGARIDHGEVHRVKTHARLRKPSPTGGPPLQERQPLPLDSTGWTALHLAALNNHVAVVERLIAGGASLTARAGRGFNGPDDAGRTPMMLARENHAHQALAVFERLELRAVLPTAPTSPTRLERGRL